MITPSDFDWQGAEAVVLREQPATAVYTNVAGAIVIRQERAWDEDSDTVIIVQPEHAETIASAILKLAGQVEGGETTLDRTAAERQRRRRAKQRDSHASVTAAERNAEPFGLVP